MSHLHEHEHADEHKHEHAHGHGRGDRHTVTDDTGVIDWNGHAHEHGDSNAVANCSPNRDPESISLAQFIALKYPDSSVDGDGHADIHRDTDADARTNCNQHANPNSHRDERGRFTR